MPGTATVDDLLRAENAGCELVEGVLVEKPAGFEESVLAGWLATLLNQFIVPRNLGIVTGEAGLMELPGGPVRGPDVAFTSWDRMSARRRPVDPIPHLAPNLVVEVLSPNNTTGEMSQKRAEYFRAGVERVWEIEPRTRTIRVYTAPDRYQDFTATDTLSGDPSLPGFTVPLAQLFAELDRHG